MSEEPERESISVTDSESESESESDEEAKFLLSFGGQGSANSDGDDEKDRNDIGRGKIVKLFEEDGASRKRREQALLHQKRLESRRWGSRSHSVRWAQGDTLHKTFPLRSGGDVKYIETPGQQLCVWDCAIVLARYLERNPSKIKNKRVIELGCGIGLPGLVSHLLGAKEVHLTDRPVAVSNLTEEIKINTNESSIDSEQEKGHPIIACALEWGPISASEYQRKIRASSRDDTDSCFEVVLCSDLIYAGDSSTTHALVESIAALTKSRQSDSNTGTCHVISCHEIRFGNSIVQEKLYVETMNKAGFTNVEYVPFEKFDPECRDEAIRIILFERE